MQPSEFTFDIPRKRRKPSLTPMIDVVFLLLVFFMLASRFGLDKAIPLSPALPGGSTYTGAPRLISVAPKTMRLNGLTIDMEVLAKGCAPLLIRVDRNVSGAKIAALLNRLLTLGVTSSQLVAEARS